MFPNSTTLANAYVALDAHTPLQPMTIVRRSMRPNDVRIEILYCGVCHSDIHHIKNDWDDSMYPMVPGHEIIGKVIEIGENVSKFRIGENVAVGNMVDSCRVCDKCKQGEEQVCTNGGASMTYNAHERYIDDKRTVYPLGLPTFGGYSNQILCHEDFTFKLPEGIHLAQAAPLLCAGITVYAPLKKFKIGPGSMVGIAGIGGVGHMGVKIARAMGATVVALTQTEWKLQDAKRLGANDAVMMTEEIDRARYRGKLDLILDTIPVPHNAVPYFTMLKAEGGKLHVLGDFQEIPSAKGRDCFWEAKYMTGSNIGGIPDTQEMIYFCYENNALPEINIINIQDITLAMDLVKKSKVKYRFVIDLNSLKQ